MISVNFDVPQTDPVDPELFLQCRRVFDAAAATRIPGGTTKDHPLLRGGRLADHPRNRGMLAVMDVLSSRRTTDAQRYSMARRLLNLELLVLRPEIARYVSRSADRGTVVVNEALLRAAARARMNVSVSGRIEYDIADVVRIASESENGR